MMLQLERDEIYNQKTYRSSCVGRLCE